MTASELNLGLIFGAPIIFRGSVRRAIARIGCLAYRTHMALAQLDGRARDAFMHRKRRIDNNQFECQVERWAGGTADKGWAGCLTYFCVALVPRMYHKFPGNHAQSLHIDELHNTIYLLSLDYCKMPKHTHAHRLCV